MVRFTKGSPRPHVGQLPDSTSVEAEYERVLYPRLPTPVQVWLGVQETPLKLPSADTGRVAVARKVQEMPFHTRASGLGVVLAEPTAAQKLADVHHTPVKAALVDAFGLGGC